MIERNAAQADRLYLHSTCLLRGFPLAGMESPAQPLKRTPPLGIPGYILPPSQSRAGIIQRNFQLQFKEQLEQGASLQRKKASRQQRIMGGTFCSVCGNGLPPTVAGVSKDFTAVYEKG